TVRVICSNCPTAAPPVAMMTSGASATNSAACLRITPASPPPDPRVAADDPAELRQCLHEYRDAFLASFLVRNASERRNASYALALLRARRERPRGCRAAKQRDERAPLHSITSSARAMSAGDTVRPSILAVSWFMTISNFVDCTTGSSAGLAPLRIRPA